MNQANNESHTTHLLLLITGGLILGFGLLNLKYSFGFKPGVDYGQDFAEVGFSGLDNISLLGPSEYAIPMVVIGALLLILANATAWKQTGGY